MSINEQPEQTTPKVHLVFESDVIENIYGAIKEFAQVTGKDFTMDTAAQWAKSGRGEPPDIILIDGTVDVSRIDLTNGSIARDTSFVSRLKEIRISRPNSRIILLLPEERTEDTGFLQAVTSLAVFDIYFVKEFNERHLRQWFETRRTFADVQHFLPGMKLADTELSGQKSGFGRKAGKQRLKKDLPDKGLTARIAKKLSIPFLKTAQNNKDDMAVQIPEQFVALGRLPGARCCRSVQEICEAKPAAVLIPAGDGAAGTIKQLRRQFILSSAPIIVVGSCDSGAYYEAGADECVEVLDRLTMEKIRNLAARMRGMWNLAVKDDLTGLYKRDFLQHYLAEQERRYRETGISFSVMICDLDHFKQVNDTYGHPAGDEVLRAFARFLNNGLRKTDVVARYGGEEFLMVFCGNENFLPIGERLCYSWSRQLLTLPGGQRIRSTFSSGLAVMGKDAGSWEELVKSSDEALYRAKNAGRNRVLPASATERGNEGSPAVIDFDKKVVVATGDRTMELSRFIGQYKRPLVVIDADCGRLASVLGVDPNTIWKHDWRVGAAVPARVNKKTEVFSVPIQREEIEMGEMDWRKLKEKIISSVKAGKKVIVSVRNTLPFNIEKIISG
ncbi:GGDEF domain protein [Desulfocucumis palustris]|uniref:GGDEF domain protein n=1 Tax=Desulfocucumis palustris TaxID=1898651 RepID=A0A2L2XMB3_9FIRM|nr:diguanylate cyclase [Desulfocucumis palustris]GBF35466.1 GGDEF domain protein [Desulfocucumis palustris]